MNRAQLFSRLQDEGLTRAEIGRRFDLSRQRVGKIIEAGRSADPARGAVVECAIPLVLRQLPAADPEGVSVLCRWAYGCLRAAELPMGATDVARVVVDHLRQPELSGIPTRVMTKRPGLAPSALLILQDAHAEDLTIPLYGLRSFHGVYRETPVPGCLAPIARLAAAIRQGWKRGREAYVSQLGERLATRWPTAMGGKRGPALTVVLGAPVAIDVRVQVRPLLPDLSRLVGHVNDVGGEWGVLVRLPVPGDIRVIHREWGP